MAEKFRGLTFDVAKINSLRDRDPDALADELRRYVWLVQRIRETVDTWDDQDAMATIPVSVIDEIIKSAKYA